jgi:hypothetical protein
VGVNSGIISWGRRFPKPENYIADLKCKWTVVWDPKKFVSHGFDADVLSKPLECLGFHIG